ncbi:DNA-binding helix-turn-helix protein [Streptococcus anginosus subsp. whileyi CCUG 39159]|uniref:DNA-binding helix-turn-helix protein n=2 Tax=Streptococcus anginosus TaxID=1328 RepID=I0SD25_STRAP|nr:putative transcriptional regulator [Streptococcus anginosus C238]EID21278.1 DNA-binding helix-turn-helix protein [Streptococcus anginosus subsp. whileyi CCUG 39159]
MDNLEVFYPFFFIHLIKPPLVLFFIYFNKNSITIQHFLYFLDCLLYLISCKKDSKMIQKRIVGMKANQLQKYISNRIRECRKEKKLSQEQLSNDAGLGIKAIQNIENLKYDFKIQTLEKVLTALDMTVEEFFDLPLSDNSVSLDTLVDNLSDLSNDKQIKLISSFNEIVKSID